jgi:hypothetical protein
MTNHKSVSDIIEEMLQSTLATPKRQRRLRSSTFWEKFGFQKRTKERVQQVKAALTARCLMTNFDDPTFGTEGKDEWIILTYIEPELPSIVSQPEPSGLPIPVPADEWFALIQQRVFESEREVEHYFVIPLLEQLGFGEDDIAIGVPVQMYEGVKKVNKEADFILYNGLSREKEDALFVVETKRSEKILTEDAVGQARGYAMWLNAPYYLVTNGDEIRTYLFRGAVQADVLLLSFRRSEMRQHWESLYRTVSREAIVLYKVKLAKALALNGI